MSKEISTLHNLVDYYLHSPQFLALRGRTQKDYEYSLGRAMQTQITPAKTLGDIKLNNLGVSECKMAYQHWVT